jgi:methylthioribulose-1-phosphate dehydratase
VYIWGPSWEKAKMMAECYDYLFEFAAKLHALGRLNQFANAVDLQ